MSGSHTPLAQCLLTFAITWHHFSLGDHYSTTLAMLQIKLPDLTFRVRLQAQLRGLCSIYAAFKDFMQKEVILFVFLRDLSFYQNMNTSPSNCSYGFYSFPHQHSPPMSGNWCMTQGELVWGLLVLSEVVYAGYKRNLSLPA